MVLAYDCRNCKLRANEHKNIKIVYPNSVLCSLYKSRQGCSRMHHDYLIRLFTKVSCRHKVLIYVQFPLWVN